ncbi:MAG: heavy-metal-associated domain-containing protein [Caldilineae bacterium]|nr:MAG: heavy-metal-associated domain-containing protein [Caldilineae bacterium]
MALTLASIRQLPGIVEVTGDLSTQTVVVTYDPDAVTPEQITQAIESAGFAVESQFQP